MGMQACPSSMRSAARFMRSISKGAFASSVGGQSSVRWWLMEHAFEAMVSSSMVGMEHSSLLVKGCLPYS